MVVILIIQANASLYEVSTFASAVKCDTAGKVGDVHGGLYSH